VAVMDGTSNLGSEATDKLDKLTIIAWSSGALASILGLWLSYTQDLPTGPLVVCMYGLLLIGAALLRKFAVP